MFQGVRATGGKPRWVSSHTRGMFAPACAALPPAPGHGSCRLSGRAKPVLAAMGPRAKGAKRLGALRCAQDCSCARAMGTLAWSKACARLFSVDTGCTRHGHLSPSLRGLRNSLRPCRRRLPPAPTGHEGQAEVARHCRRTPDKTRAPSGRFNLCGGKKCCEPSEYGRGRDASYPAPPRTDPGVRTTAPGACLGS